MLSNLAHIRLARDGWTDGTLASTSSNEMEAELQGLAESLGTPVAEKRGMPFVGHLRPISGDASVSNSLSSRFGLGSFPCHTDTAHWPTPCRFVLLACFHTGEGGRNTFLFDSDNLPLSPSEQALLRHSVFKVRNGRRSFFATIRNGLGPRLTRFDIGCMHPTCKGGEEAIGLMSSERWPSCCVDVEWTRGRFIVVDNWRVLHGRRNSEICDPGRHLARVYVKGNV
jgi:hypothetical protein